MRIAFINDWFAEKMGYAENCLPKAMASLGHEVHLVTTNVQPYFDSSIYKETYEPFIGPSVVACGVKRLDGYTLHRLPYTKRGRRLRIKGLLAKLRSLRPDVVQTFDVGGLPTYEAALVKPLLGYKLFTANHICASVFPRARRTTPVRMRRRLKWLAKVIIPGRLVGLVTEKCYPATIDCADIAVRFFGVPERKVHISPLGVDTDLFSPITDEASSAARSRLRQQLGFAPSDIMCIYTGRLSKDKNPLCLAEAIARLAVRREPFRGVFVGNGPEEYVDAIRACPGCVVHPFVPVQELPAFYRAADIGVWPKQESTSMLDAAACGIPIVVSDQVAALERIQGNGITYNEDDPQDLMRALQSLRDTGRRKELGGFGRAKILREYSWLSIARLRLQDYEAALH